MKHRKMLEKAIAESDRLFDVKRRRREALRPSQTVLRPGDAEFVAKRIIEEPRFATDYFEDRESQLMIYELLACCDSRLEVAFIAGAIAEHCTRQSGSNDALCRVVDTPIGPSVLLDGVGGFEDIGRAGVVITPQWKSPKKHITHDMRVTLIGRTGGLKGSFLPMPTDHDYYDDWHFVVEVDGYHVHRNRREKDRLRMAGLDYYTYRVSELSSNPRQWFHQAIRYVAEVAYFHQDEFTWLEEAMRKDDLNYNARMEVKP